MTTPAPVKIIPLKDKLTGLLEQVLSNSNKMGVANRLMVETLAKGLLAGMSEKDLIEGLTALRDKFIPWLLKDTDAPNEKAGTGSAGASANVKAPNQTE